MTTPLPLEGMLMLDFSQFLAGLRMAMRFGDLAVLGHEVGGTQPIACLDGQRLDGPGVGDPQRTPQSRHRGCAGPQVFQQ